MTGFRPYNFRCGAARAGAKTHEPPSQGARIYHARDDTNARPLPSLGYQDRARVRPDQDRRPPDNAATRTTRPRTAMTTHASTTGSKITDTLVGDSSPGQHPARNADTQGFLYRLSTPGAWTASRLAGARVRRSNLAPRG